MESLNIELTEDEKCMPVHDEDTLETRREGMYVAGVVCGGMDTSRLFIENSRVHALQIANHIEQNLQHL
jgi:thioredoxin reductase (NADPH)